jgi:hypothetical protein
MVETPPQQSRKTSEVVSKVSYSSQKNYFYRERKIPKRTIYSWTALAREVQVITLLIRRA